MAPQTTTELLRSLTQNQHDITLGQLIETLSDRSFGLAILVLALPNTIPLVPGFASACAIPMFIIAAQLFWGCPCIRLPQRFARITLSGARLSKLLTLCLPMLSRIERLVKPRLPLLTSRPAEQLIAFTWMVLSFVIFLPIPFGDPFPAACASLLALGMLEKDGALIATGIIASIITIYAMSYLITNLLLLAARYLTAT